MRNKIFRLYFSKMYTLQRYLMFFFLFHHLVHSLLLKVNVTVLRNDRLLTADIEIK